MSYNKLDEGEDSIMKEGLKGSVNGVKSIFKSVDRKESNQLFHQFDTNKSNTADIDEIKAFVSSNAKLWAMLSVNLGRTEEECQKVATRVVMELVSGLQGDQALRSELTKDQFHQFRKKYILDPEGSQEFFHRAVFAAFDVDNNQILDEGELEALLDTFYQSGSIFQGDVRLPPKEELKALILEKYDVAGNKRLSFGRIRGVISGTAIRDVAQK